MYVSILAVRPFLEVVVERGITREAFLDAAGIDASRLEDVNGRLAIDELDRAQEVALEVTGDPALGLHMAERATAPAYDVVGHLASHATSLRDCLQDLGRYARLVSDLTIAIEEQGDEATLVCRFLGPPDAVPVRLRTELSVAGFLRLIRSFSGEDVMPSEVLFEHRAPPHRSEYTRIFGGLERFEQPITGLRFDRALLGGETVHKNPRLVSVLTEEADRMLERLERQVTLTERLQDWLRICGMTPPPTMAEAAKHLGLGERSLRRRLADERASYPKIVEEAQAAWAMRLLQSSQRTIYEVAIEMGFSDQSAFHRAFRRWTGMTPTQFRADRG